MISTSGVPGDRSPMSLSDQARRIVRHMFKGLRRVSTTGAEYSFGTLHEAERRNDSRTPFWRFVKTFVIREARAIRPNVAFRAENKGERERAMTRQDILLAILAASQGRAYTPVQIQKAVFLVARNLPQLFDEDSTYEFIPYDYGPFDDSVYRDAELMSLDGLTEVGPSPHGRWNIYAASDAGVARGTTILARTDAQSREYITKVAAWVRSLSFQQLVKAIYDQYPDMRANSIFRY